MRPGPSKGERAVERRAAPGRWSSVSSPGESSSSCSSSKRAVGARERCAGANWGTASKPQRGPEARYGCSRASSRDAREKCGALVATGAAAFSSSRACGAAVAPVSASRATAVVSVSSMPGVLVAAAAAADDAAATPSPETLGAATAAAATAAAVAAGGEVEGEASCARVVRGRSCRKTLVQKEEENEGLFSH